MGTNKVYDSCILCWEDSNWRKLCKVCEYKIHTASALVSQNSKKLRDMLSDWKWLDAWNFERFIIYAHNIIENGRELLLYKKEVILKKIDDIENL